MEEATLALTDDRLRHVLRHFDTVSPRVAERLLAAGLSEKDLAAAVALVGSRFDPTVGDPIDLLELLRATAPTTRATQPDGSWVITWEFPVDRCPRGIGCCGIVPLATLDATERAQVHAEDRAGTRVLVLERESAPRTWMVTAVTSATRPDVRQSALRALFPGPPAPPFPGSMSLGPWRDEATAFWVGHALVRISPRSTNEKS